jgi:hypothetical protein
MKKRQPLQQMFLGKLDVCLQKTETRSMSVSCTSINSKWIKGLNTRPETSTRVGDILEAIDIGNDFLGRMQAAQQIRERIDKWDYMKLRSFCTTKKMVSKLKRPSTEREKIFANCTSDKGLMTRIYREFKKKISITQ